MKRNLKIFILFLMLAASSPVWAFYAVHDSVTYVHNTVKAIQDEIYQQMDLDFQLDNLGKTSEILDTSIDTLKVAEKTYSTCKDMYDTAVTISNYIGDPERLVAYMNREFWHEDEIRYAMNITREVMDMADSMAVNFAYHANDPSVGFSLHADYNCFKMFLADTGLFVTLAFMDRDYTENIIYRKLLSDKLSADLGYVYENVIAQMLKSAGNKLFYYTFKEEEPKVGDDNKVIRNYEIDFLLSRKDKICPIEVKASGYNSHKSLDKFQQKFSGRILHRYLLYTKDLKKDNDILCLPAYMTELL